MSNDKKLTMKNTTIQQDEKGHNANIVLAVSGLPEFEFVNKIFIEKYPEYDMRSRLHTVELNEVKLIDVLYDYFEALRAACASGAVDTVAERGINDCIFYQHKTCICKDECWYTVHARKSSEGQP